jgi:ABC-type nitrate/sulfonate/bicarbonate transport system substrate-binding protein
MEFKDTAEATEYIVAVVNDLLAYRYRAGAINFQLEKADDYFDALAEAVEWCNQHEEKVWKEAQVE